MSQIKERLTSNGRHFNTRIVLLLIGYYFFVVSNQFIHSQIIDIYFHWLWFVKTHFEDSERRKLKAFKIFFTTLWILRPLNINSITVTHRSLDVNFTFSIFQKLTPQIDYRDHTHYWLWSEGKTKWDFHCEHLEVQFHFTWYILVNFVVFCELITLVTTLTSSSMSFHLYYCIIRLIDILIFQSVLKSCILSKNALSWRLSKIRENSSFS